MCFNNLKHEGCLNPLQAIKEMVYKGFWLRSPQTTGPHFSSSLIQVSLIPSLPLLSLGADSLNFNQFCMKAFFSDILIGKQGSCRSVQAPL